MTHKPLFTSETGTEYTWEDDGLGGGLIHSRQEVDDILELNGKLYTANDGFSPSRELRRVGSIPMSLIYLWQSVEGWNPLHPSNSDRLARKLNDIDFLKLRTAPGKLGIIDGGGGFR